MNTFMEDLLDLLVGTTTPQETFDKMARMARSLGFEHCAYGMRAPLSFSGQNMAIFSDYPPSRQPASDHLDVGPSSQWCADALEPIIWHDSNSRGSLVAWSWKDARNQDITFGLSLPLKTSTGGHGVLAVSRGRKKPDMREIHEKFPRLTILGQIAHQALAWQMIEQARPNGEDALSARETEILRWVADGYASKHIAAKTGITESTVNFHLQNAMNKLQVRNRAAAIAHAMALGILD